MKTMILKGINSECKNTMMCEALKKAGIKTKIWRARWPRKKGVAGVRIDCGTGNAVGFVN